MEIEEIEDTVENDEREEWKQDETDAEKVKERDNGNKMKWMHRK